MKKGNKKLFLEEEGKLQEMLELRKGGWSYNALAKKYGCDHSSIIYQCQKNGVFNNNIQTTRIVSEVKKEIIKNNFPNWTEEQTDEAIRMRMEGIFVRIIAGKIGKTIHTVNRFFNRIRLPATTTPSQRASVIKEKCLWQDDGMGERVYLGKSYKEYFEEDKRKEDKRKKELTK